MGTSLTSVIGVLGLSRDCKDVTQAGFQHLFIALVISPFAARWWHLKAARLKSGCCSGSSAELQKSRGMH